MEDKRIKIDPDKFANNFASSIMSGSTYNQKTVLEDSKKYLVCYLVAYYLVKDFNKAENTNFQNASKGMEKQFRDLTFPELLEKVRKLNKY